MLSLLHGVRAVDAGEWLYFHIHRLLQMAGRVLDLRCTSETARAQRKHWSIPGGGNGLQTQPLSGLAPSNATHQRSHEHTVEPHLYRCGVWLGSSLRVSPDRGT